MLGGWGRDALLPCAQPIPLAVKHSTTGTYTGNFTEHGDLILPLA